MGPGPALAVTGTPERPVVAVVGATATGKSGVAVALALALGAEVVNADASQLYRGMDIGTAKLPVAERRGVPHHLLDVLHVTQEASVATYQRDARAVIAQIADRGGMPVLVGGSGLYVRAVLDPLEFPGTDPQVRDRISATATEIGPRALHDRLADVDPAAAAAIPPANVRRVVRALEVIELTGRRFTASLPSHGYVRPTVQVGLRADRALLDQRIERRVDAMFEAGLLEEVRKLDAAGLRQGRTASRALGYSQVLDHLDGRTTLAQARDSTAAATRAFARRQEKWFRRDARIHWVDVDASEHVDAEGVALAARVVGHVRSLVR